MSKKIRGLAPEVPETSTSECGLALRLLNAQSKFDDKTYEYYDSFRAGDPSNFRSVHSMAELRACIEGGHAEAEGIFLEANSDGVYRYRRLNSAKKIKEVWKANSRLRKFRECAKHESVAMREDGFASDYRGSTAGANAGLVGDDFVPLLGGPFNKQPYLDDYLRAHAYAFHEYHHHPFARAIVHITRDFVLGRGYTIDSDDDEALALWRAFEQANKLPEKMEHIVSDGCRSGETMIWWLPNSETQIAYQVQPGQEPAKGVIPRIRLLDPSTCWEIVTFPEDIERVLYYQLVFPTQYQIFTGKSGGKSVPTSKFIMQQLPAEDVMHFKYNCAPNEKRGRSDLFPIFGYLKWVRDCVNYKLISLKKQAAWTEDIVVEGSQADVDNLTNALNALGPFEPAGSRFIHTDKIKREYMANQTGGGSADSDTLMNGVDMIAVGAQIPASYFGMMKAAGQTKGSALVGTEPVAKKFERRQEECKRILTALWRRFQDRYGKAGSECRISFPEIISQDSSQKLKDIKFAEDCGYISRPTAAPLAAKELSVDNYDYDTEKGLMDEESKDEQPIQTLGAPLTAPATAGGTGPSSGAASAPPTQSAVTGQQRASFARKG